MTTLGLRPLTRGNPRAALQAGLFVAWLAVALAAFYGWIAIPRGLALALVFLVPPVLIVLALLRRGQGTALPLAAGGAAALVLAVSLPPIITLQPKFAFAFPAIVLGAVVTGRFPAAALGGVFFITGTYGSIEAFTPVPSVSLAHGLLMGLWAGIAGRLLIGGRPYPIRPSPALLMMGGFFLVTIAMVLLAPTIGGGIKAFRIGPLLMSALLLVGWGGFHELTLERLARAIAWISLGVGAYAALRWAIGPAAQEASLFDSESAAQYNTVAETGETKVQGSLPNGRLLGVWLACSIPFLVALTIAWTGRTRFAAMAALPLSLIGLLGSGQRAAVAAVAAGAATVIVLHMVSRGFRGPRLGVALAAVAALLAAASVVFPLVLDSPQSRERYANILTPSEDVPFQERLVKWRQVLSEVEGEPFGFGLGSGSPGIIPQRFASVASVDIDNSYLLIAFEQGVFVMLFFIVALFVLLFELIRHAVWTRARTASALTAAAAGTLVSMMVEFISANNIATLPILAGWMIVGLGVAQYGVRRDEG